MARPKLAPESKRSRVTLFLTEEEVALVNDVVARHRGVSVAPKPGVVVAPKPEPVVLVAPKPVAPVTVRPHVSMLKDKWVKPVKRGSAADGPDW